MSLARYVLDTDTASFFLRGRHGLRDRIATVGELRVTLSRVTYAELRIAVHLGQSPRLSAATVDELAAALGILEPAPAAWDRFSLLAADVRRSGGPPGNAGRLDILQAAIAIENDLTLVTHNRKHFEPLATLAPLKWEDWVEPR